MSPRADVGQPGGHLVVVQRTEPRTLNPITAVDSPSRDVIRRTTADLIHINRETQQLEPALAKSWTASPDGRRFTLQLRRGVRFSDGDAFDADDVMFSFQVYLDEKVASPQRDNLIVGGKPIAVTKLDQYSVQVDVAEPYSSAERLFDSVAMLPRHLLEQPYKEGRLVEAWGLRTPAAAMAGLGPFRFAEHVPGDRLVLERNPNYWKEDRAGKPLPYLDRVVFIFVPSEDAQAVRFQAGEADVPTRLSATNFELLLKDQPQPQLRAQGSRRRTELRVPVLQPERSWRRAGRPRPLRRRRWFRQLAFRQAVASAIDRDAIVRLTYRGRATPLWGHVPPGNKIWVNQALPKPARSLDRARQQLRAAGFSWLPDGTLIDDQRPAGGVHHPDQLRQCGTEPNRHHHPGRSETDRDARRRGDARSERVARSRLDDARLRCVRAGSGGGDGDPNSEMNVWLSSGATHVVAPAPEGAGHAVGGGNRRADAGTDQDARCRSAASASTIASSCWSPRTCRSSAWSVPMCWLAPPRDSRTSVRLFSIIRRCGISKSCSGAGDEPVPSSDRREKKPRRLFGNPDVTWSDTRLVRACLDGNEQAWATLIAKYKNLIYSIPLKYGAPPQDAADIFQSVCLELFSELPRLRSAEAVRSWIIKVTSHQSYHWKRKLRRLAEDELTPIDEEQLSAELPPDLMEEIERAQILREAVAALPPRCREIIRLLFYEPEPISYRDLAARLGLATGSIGFIRGRCLQRLERALHELGF